MLIELKVKNFAIIENLTLTFGPGLNILSGETGAGKSILLKSLSLLMGEKAESDIIRSGVEQAIIEGYFDLNDRADVVEAIKGLGFESADDSLIVRRIIGSSGKSKVYINGSLSPLNVLRSLVAPLITMTGKQTPLIEMTGQHDNRHLQSKAYHLELLDVFSNSMNLRQEFERQYVRLRELDHEIHELTEAQRSREQRLDFLKFQCDEIEALNLRVGEEEELESSLSRQRNSSRLMEFVSESVDSLYSGEDAVMARMHHVLARGNELASIDADILNRMKSLSEAKALIEDTSFELREYGRGLESDPQELDRIEERLTGLRKLQKKFGQSVEEILAAYQEMKAEIESLDKSEQNLQTLEEEKLKLSKMLGLLAKQLHGLRTKGATKLEKAVNEELDDLNMKGVIFHVHIVWMESLIATGQSDVEFMIQVSKKDEPKPIGKVASGGELSRILLALKTIVGSSDLPHTYLFDEVDTGVSGETAEKVGRKLKSIAKDQQLICVTHLPQVASFADCHYLIEKKNQKDGVIKMTVEALDKDARVREIARLISGEKITPTSLSHARALLQN